jgi:hypothetical protein
MLQKLKETKTGGEESKDVIACPLNKKRENWNLNAKLTFLRITGLLILIETEYLIGI